LVSRFRFAGCDRKRETKGFDLIGDSSQASKFCGWCAVLRDKVLVRQVGNESDLVKVPSALASTAGELDRFQATTRTDVRKPFR